MGDARRRSRRLRVRTEEARLVAAAAQRWVQTPDAWGGGASQGLAAATLAGLALANRPGAPGVYATAHGQYRAYPVPPCPQLARAAAHLDVEAPATGGLLVVGTGTADEDAVAVLVLGPLVQVTLSRVPWAWVRATAHAAAAAEAETRVQADVPVLQTEDLPDARSTRPPATVERDVDDRPAVPPHRDRPRRPGRRRGRPEHLKRPRAARRRSPGEVGARGSPERAPPPARVPPF